MQFDLSTTLVALLGFLSAVDAFPAPRPEACTTYPQCIPDGPGPSKPGTSQSCGGFHSG
ncbi:unnamed protein product [Cercospora beticola]|nr:unnamed protein product [Cercospora beticola]